MSKTVDLDAILNQTSNPAANEAASGPFTVECSESKGRTYANIKIVDDRIHYRWRRLSTKQLAFVLKHADAARKALSVALAGPKKS